MKQIQAVFPHLPLTPDGYYRRFFDMHRRFLPHPLQVHHLYYYPRKAKVVDWPQGATGCFTLCLILQGTGSYSIFGKTWRVQAPCVLTLWPGFPLRFAPDRDWEEFSISYSLRDLPRLTRWKIAMKRRPLWPIMSQLPIQHYLNQLSPIINQPTAFGQSDRLDMLCHLLIMETIIGYESRQIPANNKTAIEAVEREVANTIPSKPDFAALAVKHKLTYPTLRRMWMRFYSIPPAHYAIRLKIEAACRLLQETELQVQEIADRLKFCDAYYFSKQFHRVTGLSPKAYRHLRQR